MGMDPASWAAIAAVAIPAITALGKEVFGGGTDTAPVSNAGQAKIANMGQASKAVGAYRADQADARMKAMAQQLSGFQGAGNMMQAMYGGGGKANIGGYKPGGGGYTPFPTGGMPPSGGGNTIPDPISNPGVGGTIPNGHTTPGPGGATFPDSGNTWTPPRPPGHPGEGDWKNPPPPSPPPIDPTRPGWGNEPPGLIGGGLMAAPPTPPMGNPGGAPPPNPMVAQLAAAMAGRNGRA